MCAASRLSRQGSCNRPSRSWARCVEIMKNGSLDCPLFSINTARDVLSTGPDVLAGEIAAARGQFDQAIAHLERAVRLEDALVYTEPSELQSPPRLTLGAILLESGRPAEAETVYWEDLRTESQQRVGTLWIDAGIARAKKG